MDRHIGMGARIDRADEFRQIVIGFGLRALVVPVEAEDGRDAADRGGTGFGMHIVGEFIDIADMGVRLDHAGHDMLARHIDRATCFGGRAGRQNGGDFDPP